MVLVGCCMMARWWLVMQKNGVRDGTLDIKKTTPNTNKPTTATAALFRCRAHTRRAAVLR